MKKLLQGARGEGSCDWGPVGDEFLLVFHAFWFGDLRELLVVFYLGPLGVLKLLNPHFGGKYTEFALGI